MTMHRSRLWSLALGVAVVSAPAAGVCAADPMQGDSTKAPPATTQPAAPEQPAAPAINVEAINLRPMFVQGRTSRYEIWSHKVQDVTMRMGPNQRQASRTTQLKGEISWTVQTVRPDGSATCVMTFEYLTLEMTDSSGDRVFIDSRHARSDNEMMHTFLRAMTGVALRMEVSPEGTPLAVSGTQGIRQKMGSLPAEAAPDDLDFIENASELATLPGAPETLAVGGNWAMNYQWKHEMGHLKHDAQYVLSDVQEIAGIPIAIVDQTARLQLIPDYSKLPQGGPKVDIRQLAGTYQRQVMFDLQRHDTVGSNTTSSLTVEVRITLPNNQVITRTIVESAQEQVLRIAEDR